MIDRFDTMIDTVILSNCREEFLVEKAIMKLTSPISEAEMLRLLMNSDNLQDALDIRLKNSLRNSILRQRHSKKLCILFSLFQPDCNCWLAPCVNISTGEIKEKIKPRITSSHIPSVAMRTGCTLAAIRSSTGQEPQNFWIMTVNNSRRYLNVLRPLHSR